MARNHYTATFPAASPGDEVTWASSARVYPDAQTQVAIPSAYLNESRAVSVYSEAASLALTVCSETLTVTTGSPSATGAAASSPSGGSSLITGALLAVSSDGASDIADGAQTAIHFQNVDRDIGDGISVGVDEITITVTEGLYLVGLTVQATGPTSLYAAVYPDSGTLVSPYNASEMGFSRDSVTGTGVDVSVFVWIEFGEGGGTLSAHATPRGGVTDITWAAMDIRRLPIDYLTVPA